MVILAKPIKANEYWILRQDDEKIGNIEATSNGYTVKIRNTTQQFKTINMIKQRAGIDFEQARKKSKQQAMTSVYGFPAGCRVYNPLFEVRQHLPLFTKTAKSKSWYAAGWYKIYQNRAWQIVQSPKLITLQRYKYVGPFVTKEDVQ